MSACEFTWCDTDSDLHSEDPTFHTRQLGFGIQLAVNTSGVPEVYWGPDFSEWTADVRELRAGEFDTLIRVLQSIPDEFARFVDTLQGGTLHRSPAVTAELMERDQ